MTGWTLGKVKASVFDLEAHCENENCRHFYVFSLDPLIESVGADFAVENIPLLSCQQCGGPLKVWLAAPDPREQEEDNPADTLTARTRSLFASRLDGSADGSNAPALLDRPHEIARHSQRRTRDL